MKALAIFGVVGLALLAAGCEVSTQNTTTTTTTEPAQSPAERGRYLVNLGGCTDCHTPGYFFGMPDMSRLLGGSEVGFFFERSLPCCFIPGVDRNLREPTSLPEIDVKRKELASTVGREEVVSEGVSSFEVGFEVFSSPRDSGSVMLPALRVVLTVRRPGAV